MGRIKKGVMGWRCDVSDGAGMESTGRGRWRLFSKANQRKPMAFVCAYSNRKGHMTTKHSS